jgi:hypothetical protein
MARYSEKKIHIIIAGKRPIAAFKHKANAIKSLETMNKVLPDSQKNLGLRIESVDIQD